MNKTIQTQEEIKQMIKDCSTKSILENDLTELEQQLAQIQNNISLVKLALLTPESEEEYIARQEKEVA